MSERDELLLRLRRLWGRERAAAKARYRAERVETPFAERRARGLALEKLTVDDAFVAPGNRTMVWLAPTTKGGLEGLRLGPGDPVVVWRDDPEEAGAVQGVLARRRKERLGVMVSAEVAERLDDGVWNLDREAPQETFDRGDDALRRLRDAPERSALGRLREVLLGERPPVFEAPTPWTPVDTGLNAPQREAVERALAAEDVALIHGPPGTGKTRTLVEVILQEVERGRRVLAVAASNTAVDNLAERLVRADLEVVRLGHPARVSAAMEARALDALMESHHDAALARSWMDQARSLRRDTLKRWGKRRITWGERQDAFREVGRLFRDARESLAGIQEALLDRAQVLCATAAGADAALLGDRRFDVVVLDEATQAPDPIALVAFVRAERVVLAGDPCQLPPAVLDRDAEQGGLGTTFFERLAARWGGDAADPRRLLTVQYRMHEDLMRFPSTSMYEGRLEAAPEVAQRTLADLGVEDDPLRPGPLVLVDTAGKGWEEVRDDQDPSTRNPEQGARTVAEVRRLLSRGLDPESVAVIAPYDAQVRLLRQALEPERAAGLEVGSIDGFQGREKEAVVLDLVRSNDQGQIGFLGDTRRMNVALTRAKRFLLVVADSATLSGHPYYAAAFAAVEAHGAWVSAWSDEAELLNAPPQGA